MKSISCPICGNSKIINLWWKRDLSKCKYCGLFFNEINIEYDYENSTNFTNDGKII